MRVPSFERFQKVSTMAAFFVCGAIVGAAAFNGLSHAAYSNVVEHNYELMAQIEAYQDEIKRLNSDIGKDSVIQGIVVFIGVPEGKPPIDVVAEKELKTRIKKDLASLRGRKVYNIGKDAAFVTKIFEKKIYSGIGENDYAVRFTTILVADGVLQVWVEARVYLQP